MVLWQTELKYVVQPKEGWVPPSRDKLWPIDGLRRLALYYEKQWMTEKMLEWNHWESGSIRTTNAAEAFHGILSR